MGKQYRIGTWIIDFNQSKAGRLLVGGIHYYPIYKADYGDWYWKDTSAHIDFSFKNVFGEETNTSIERLYQEYLMDVFMEDMLHE